MNRDMKRVLSTLAVVDGRSLQRILAIVGGSRATFKRDLGTLRELGAQIRYDPMANAYRLIDSGVIDVIGLRTKTLRCEPKFEPLIPQQAVTLFEAWKLPIMAEVRV